MIDEVVNACSFISKEYYGEGNVEFDVFNLKNASYKGMLNTVHYVQESHFHFDDEMFDLPKKEDYSLYGFFQTEKYFKHIEDSIRIDFSFKDEIKNYCEPLR